MSSPVPSSPRPKPTIESNWLPRAMAQRAAAALLVVSLVGIGLHWARHQQERNRLVDVDRTPIAIAKFQIDINQADWPEFALLPGVGEVLAKRIVADRQANGPFQDWYDLRRVRGIGPKTFEAIKPYLQPLADLNATAGP